ncbi:MAG: BglII/BstYI family type II restriction endonuclease [Planctomycetota bacterium]
MAEGLSVPKCLEEWIRAPDAGKKRPIKLVYDGGEVTATLRRLANARSHVQIKYENKDAACFRQWLSKVFSARASGMEGEYLELVRIEGDTFQVNAFPINRRPAMGLVVSEWVFHRTSEKAVKTYESIREIPAIVRGVEFNASEGQSFYNLHLHQAFKQWHWQSERQVHPDLLLKCDFGKGPVLVEIEFGNARTYYQDYIKFMLAFKERAAEVGVLLVPVQAFARLLCDVGRRKALARGRRYYSGMIDMGKVRRELPYLDFMLSMPLAIGGVDVTGVGA